MSFENLSPEVIERARNIKLLLMDCDGVLTDGKLYFSSDGEELKAFHVHDGQGITNWHKAGFHSGIITGRESQILKRRVEELEIHYLIQNSKSKVRDFEKILAEENLSVNEVAFIGDDLADKELLDKVGLPIVVANCVSELDAIAFYKTTKAGGNGGVREVIDLLLKIKSNK